MQEAAFQQKSVMHVYSSRWYRRAPWKPFFYVGLGAFFLADGIRTHWWWDLCIGILNLILVPLSIMDRQRVGLIVAPEGIVYHIGRAALTVPWQDMEYIGRSTQQGRYRGWEGIIVRKANWKHPLPWPNRWYPQFIPLWSRQSGPQWDRELFGDLFFYAPWLATNGENGTVPIDWEDFVHAEASRA